MKRTLLTLAMIITALSMNVMANDGNQQSADVTATAVVLAELELNAKENINWGQVARGANPKLNPETGAATDGAGLNASTTSIGKFELIGEPTASILVNWTKENLSKSGGAPGDNIEFTPDVTYGDVDGDFGGSTITNGSTQTIAVGGTNYIWAGGTINVAANQTAGTYEGSFTLIVEYN